MKKYTTIFLAVDDTLQAKFGKKFACYFKLFDHTSKNETSYLNGHCFVSLAINIPVFIGKTARYLTIPVGYRLYDKQQSKLKIAASLVHTVMPLLEGYQVVLLCDSWYPKGEVIGAVKAYENLDLICSVRSDTVLYDFPPALTGKRGRPRKYGDKLDIKSFDYEKAGDYYIASRQVLTNLFGTRPITVTVTVKNIEAFESIRVFISTVAAQNLCVFKEHEMEGIPTEPEKQKYLHHYVYSLRWSIEVLFYEHKFFWSFGNYMVRTQAAIERYVNLISLTFAFVQILPFHCKQFKEYRFQSPQVIKRVVADQLSRELIFEAFVQSLENNKNYTIIAIAVKGFLGLDKAA